MQLIEVNSPALALQFHEVPFRLYRSDPQWIPAIRQDVEKLFDPAKNKLFKEGAKAIRWLLADEKGELIGRIAAFVNPRALIPGKMQAGGMGFFDCIDNQEAADILLTAAKEWLQKLGMEAMDGPVNLGDRQQFWGCQVSNWEEPPIYPMNYNPPYAQRLLEHYGFEVYFNQFLYHRVINVPAQPVFYRKVALLHRVPDLKVTDIRGIPLEKVAEDFRAVYNSGWGGHSHFKELSSEAALKIMKAMKPAIDPEIIFFVYQKEVPLAFFINLPELNQIFRHVNGNMNWLGKLKFLYHKLRKTPNRMTGIVFGVVREWHGKGLEALMIVHSEKAVPLKGQYYDTVLSWIGDFNPKMIRVAENLGASVWRKYHTYRYQFDRNIPFERAPIVE
jgi:hypothetical protein